MTQTTNNIGINESSGDIASGTLEPAKLISDGIDQIQNFVKFPIKISAHVKVVASIETPHSEKTNYFTILVTKQAAVKGSAGVGPIKSPKVGPDFNRIIYKEQGMFSQSDFTRAARKAGYDN